MSRLLRRAAALLVLSGMCVAVHAAPGDAPAIPDTLKQRIASCTACHGESGEGADNAFFPRLAGKPQGYLLRQLQDFRNGVRHYAIMEYTVQPLDDDYLREIAGYFAAQDVPYRTHPIPTMTAAQTARGEELVTRGDKARGVPACTACHGTNLTGVEPAIPGLIGLPYDYLSAQLGSWRTDTRRAVAPDCMAAVVSRLSDADISAAAAYLAAHPIPDDPHPQPAGSVTMPLRCGSVGS
jgi:cytochrome c553